MKYIHAMLHIWSNMWVGRSQHARFALGGFFLIALFHCFQPFLYQGWIRWVGFGIAFFSWFFVFPSVIFLIDLKRKYPRVKIFAKQTTRSGN